jgi:hypothetical protein
MVGIDDTYEAFCIDEAAAYVYYKEMDGNKPLEEKEKENEGLKLLLNVATDIKG